MIQLLKFWPQKWQAERHGSVVGVDALLEKGFSSFSKKT
jgi:hypothetical protein